VTGLPTTADALVIGAGLAGCAAAYQLTRSGITNVLILEREPAPGRQGSAQNAALIRQHAANPATAALARAGRDWCAEHRGTFEKPFFRQTGSILIGGRASAELVTGYHRDRQRWLRGAEAYELSGCDSLPAGRALWTEGDGVADPAALIDNLLHAACAAGAQVAYGVEAHRLDSGRVTVGDQTVSAGVVVAATGAWAQQWLPLPIQPFRRHLFYAPEPCGVAQDAPWIWDLDGEVYLRREGAGLLLCACDENPAAAGPVGRWPEVDPAASEWLAERLVPRWPQFANLAPQRTWAGLRCLSPDDAFVLGPDPRDERLIWIAGLGGHGVTCAVPAARLALSTITSENLGDFDVTGTSVRRFASLSETWDA
jgi:glycine/D-amino acid oxidase-like deaminating enzyme